MVGHYLIIAINFLILRLAMHYSPTLPLKWFAFLTDIASTHVGDEDVYYYIS